MKQSEISGNKHRENHRKVV